MMTIAIIAAIVLLALGVPIFGVFLLLAGAGAMDSSREFFMEFDGSIRNLFSLGTNPITAPILSTIPLFIFTGFVLAASKTADRTVRAAQAALGWLPGGLAIATILACAVFTTFTGASGVTIVALGGLLMPSLLKERYPERFSLGLLAGTGSIGLLFPPAVPLFVYGTIYGLAAQAQAATKGGETIELIAFSTDRFILAGIVPGLLLIAMMAIYAVVVAIKRDVPRRRFDSGELGRALLVALPELMIPFLIIGGLVSGLLLPQVAALCVVYVLFIEIFVYKDLAPSALRAVLKSSMGLAGAIFVIILCAQAFTNYLVTAEVPQQILAFILDTFQSKWTFLLALNVMLLVVGMVMDIFSAIVVVVPLIAPAATRMGIDPFHLGVIFLLNLEVGYLHPPVGLNLFVTSFTFRKPILEVTIAALPPLAIMIVALGVVTYVPWLTEVSTPAPARRGRVAELASRVHAAAQEVTAIDEVTMPDGKVLQRSACAALASPEARTDCNGVFIDVTRCRAEAGGAIGGACETKAIAAYVELAAGDADDEETDWDAEEEDAGPDP